MGNKVVDLDHTLGRMVLHASDLLRDIEAIEAARGRTRTGGYILQLIATEILLKAGAARETGEVPFGHETEQLFALQPVEVQAGVERRFQEAELGLHGAPHSTLLGQLQVLGRNFSEYRYVYEPWIEHTEADRLEREREFVEGTLPPEEYDVIFYAPLLDILTTELLDHLASWRPSDWAPTRWDAS